MTERINEGRLIVFEGPDGVGKSTLSLALANRLKAMGLVCQHLSFPGKDEGTLGRLVYDVHHDPGGYVNRCVNDIRRRPSQPLIQWRFHPHTVHRGRRLRSTQGLQTPEASFGDHQHLPDHRYRPIDPLVALGGVCPKPKPESTEGGRRVSILKWPEGALLNLG